MENQKWIHSTCKIGQEAECCRYLLAGSDGFECAKVNPILKLVVDKDWAINEHVAQGDNCEGVIDNSVLNQNTL